MRLAPLAALSALGLLLLPAPTSARTWYITPDGTGDAPTIQAGIDSAAVADTVSLAPGTYLEHDLTLGLGVTVTGPATVPPCVTIDAQGLGPVFIADGIECTVAFLRVTRGERTAVVGGGLRADNAADVRIHDVEFTENLSVAVFARWGTIDLQRCQFVSNNGGGVLLIDSNSATVRDCDFIANHGPWGSGLVCISCWNVDISDCWFERNTSGGIRLNAFGTHCTVTRTVFLGNIASTGGGLFVDSASHAIVSECTFFENRATFQGSAFYGPVASMTNSILAFGRGGGSVSAYAATLSCCDVFGNIGGDWIRGIEGQESVRMNVSADPLFCDPDGGSFYLQWGSPCLPANSNGCGLIGRYGFGGCNSVSVTPESWGKVKAGFRTADDD